MQTITMPVFLNYQKMRDLHRMGQAKPIGKAPAESCTQWVATDTRQRVVYIGTILKKDIQL